MRSGWTAIVIVTLAGAAASSCMGAKAQTVPEAPPLAVPAPPPRVIPAPPPEPPEEAVPPTIEASPKPASAAGPARRRVETVKPDAKKTETPPAVEPAPPPAPPASLQSAPVATQTEMERRTRDYIAQAANNLGKVTRGSLDAGGRDQFDTAQRFLQRAQQALAEKNFVYAQTLAEKAATIAADLAKRVP